MTDYKKSKAPTNTTSRDIMELCKDTGNIYESVAILSKRANQLSAEIKHDLSTKLQEFASYSESIEEVYENREQVEISTYYEKLPKPSLMATQEFLDGEIYWRNPADDKNEGTEKWYNASRHSFCCWASWHAWCACVFPLPNCVAKVSPYLH